jgi:hypothetical protein
MTYSPSVEERQAYVEGYCAVNQYNLKSHKFLPNPHSAFTEQLLWEAWEVGFNDAFEDEMSVLSIIEELSNGQENSNDD